MNAHTLTATMILNKTEGIGFYVATIPKASAKNLSRNANSIIKNKKTDK
jgi:hypothetical protein